jgi:predicted extracellular nuclease
VENLDPSDAATMPRLAQLVVDNMRAPDLIGIEEMQDNSGATDDEITDASASWQAFIGAIIDAGGPQYDDDGDPGGWRPEQPAAPSPEGRALLVRLRGNSEVLDQILASGSALATLRGFDVVHVNAEFADQAGDHDPSVARFELRETGGG